ncbi:MAG: hypothetical protein C0501_23765 [Isosphaera sp.]|nr:hypothetical protein [Isosphaera sp.]
MLDPDDIPMTTDDESVEHPPTGNAAPADGTDAENRVGSTATDATAETTTDDLTTTPPSPDHLAFLRGLPEGEFGFGLMVYADRVEEDGLAEAAHVLRHHDGYLAYRTYVVALHRAICAQVERIFGCRYAPGRPMFDSPEPHTYPTHPGRVYVRKSSLRCFTDWPPRPDETYERYELDRLLERFEKMIARVEATETRHLVLRGRPLQYEVAILPLMLAYLSGLPVALTATRPRGS